MKRILSVILCVAIALTFCFEGGIAAVAGEPTIYCENIKCKPGDTVTVDIIIENNPGIMYLELTPVFAAEFGEPDIQNGNIFPDFTQAKQYVWTADGNVGINGKLLSIKFNIPKTISNGEYSLGFVFRSAYDYDENSINFMVKSGTVTVSSDNYTPGDINGDGDVNNKDFTRLFQYLSKWDDIKVNEAALDVNGDKSIDNKDLTRLFQYLSDWEVDIF